MCSGAMEPIRDCRGEDQGGRISERLQDDDDVDREARAWSRIRGRDHDQQCNRRGNGAPLQDHRSELDDWI